MPKAASSNLTNREVLETRQRDNVSNSMWNSEINVFFSPTSSSILSLMVLGLSLNSIRNGRNEVKKQVWGNIKDQKTFCAGIIVASAKGTPEKRRRETKYGPLQGIFLKRYYGLHELSHVGEILFYYFRLFGFQIRKTKIDLAQGRRVFEQLSHRKSLNILQTYLDFCSFKMAASFFVTVVWSSLHRRKHRQASCGLLDLKVSE